MNTRGRERESRLRIDRDVSSSGERFPHTSKNLSQKNRLQPNSVWEFGLR